ncbi:MAG: hypothetical protein ACRD0K_31125 [Egibacteraceae bacterium]
MVLLVDGFSALRAEYDEPAVQWVADDLARIAAEGPALGILTAITADRTGAVPTALSSTVSQKWLFRLADPYDYAMFGVRLRSPAALAPGRCVIADTGQLIQIGRPGPSLAVAVARVAAASSPPARQPATLGTLPTSVGPEALGGAARVGQEPWLLPVGIAERTLEPALLRVYPAEHALVAGPARSGRSGLLCALARLLAAATPRVGLTAVAARPSPLRRLDCLDRVVTDARALPEALAQVADAGGRQVVLIDDAEALDDVAGAVDRLLRRLLPDVRVIAAGRADVLRSAYGHWTQTVRRSGAGVLLRPDTDLDGDLLGVRLPRLAPVPVTAARGWLAGAGDLPLADLGHRRADHAGELGVALSTGQPGGDVDAGDLRVRAEWSVAEVLCAGYRLYTADIQHKRDVDIQGTAGRASPQRPVGVILTERVSVQAS